MALSLQSFSQIEDLFRLHFSQRTQSGPLFPRAEPRLAPGRKTARVRAQEEVKRLATAREIKARVILVHLPGSSGDTFTQASDTVHHHSWRVESVNTHRQGCQTCLHLFCSYSNMEVKKVWTFIGIEQQRLDHFSFFL